MIFRLLHNIQVDFKIVHVAKYSRYNYALFVTANTVFVVQFQGHTSPALLKKNLIVIDGVGFWGPISCTIQILLPVHQLVWYYPFFLSENQSIMG